MEAADPRLEAARLIATQTWCALGTVDPVGVPSVTYVPFAVVDGAFGVVVSRLAAHTASLLARRPASILLVGDELPPSDAYTRARFTIGVRPAPQIAGSKAADAVWSALAARQGATVGILRTLPDFDAVRLEPLDGRLILGFASAHDLAAGAIVEMLR